VKGQGLLLSLVTLVVLVAVTFGFLALGTPGEARKQELDRTRIDNLRDASNAIIYGWNARRELPPTSIEAFMEGRPLKAPWVDPVTRKPYRYTNLGDGKFELCATFDTEVSADEAEYGNEWAHPAGSHCFKFDVKKDLAVPGGRGP